MPSTTRHFDQGGGYHQTTQHELAVRQTTTELAQSSAPRRTDPPRADNDEEQSYRAKLRNQLLTPLLSLTLSELRQLVVRLRLELTPENGRDKTKLIGLILDCTSTLPLREDSAEMSEVGLDYDDDEGMRVACDREGEDGRDSDREEAADGDSPNEGAATITAPTMKVARSRLTSSQDVGDAYRDYLASILRGGTSRTRSVTGPATMTTARCTRRSRTSFA